MGTSPESIRQIGPYRLGEVLGEGGMGIVYRGLHEILERPVALKRLLPGRSLSWAMRKRFLREAQAAARLNHPAVVQVYDILEHDGDDWIVMELVEGTNLNEVVEKAPLPWPRAVGIGESVAAALAAAHAVAILHRDLKTENVILTDVDEVKVLDFGLAKDLDAQDEADELSRTRGVAGTPRSLSPEQAMGLPLDYRSDLFSLGVLLYEILSGRSPFSDKTLLATLNNICSTSHVPLREAEPSVPEALSELVDRLLEKNPEKRPPDARTVGEILHVLGERSSGSFSRPGGVSGWRPPLRPSNPDSFLTPRSSGSRISESGLEERRQVIVVACELDAAESEQLQDILPELQERARSLVRSRQGCFVQTPGSRLVVCVGYPRAFEDDARSAVSLARSMLAEVAEVAGGREIAGLEARCGLHAGIAFTPAETTEGGEPELGPLLDRAVDVARRAGSGGLLVSETAAPLLSEHFSTRRLGDPEGPGLYEIPAEAERQVSDADWLLGEMTPPIGRETEIRLLADTFRAAAEGTFQAVQICGEGGIGKSKVLVGLRARLRPERLRWITLPGSPETANSPFFPMSSLLTHLLDLSPEMSTEERASSLDALSEELGLEDDELLPWLAPLLSTDVADLYSTPALSPELRKERTLEALTNVLAWATEREPLVLVFEDLHWLDPSTLEWITLLVEERSIPSLYLVLTFRPHFVPPWGHRADILQLNLNPLAREPTRRLVAEILGEEELPPKVVESIIAKTDGVPLYLEQLTRAVLEAKASGAAGESTPTDVQIPGTLRASLTARLDRLGPAKTVAQFASVVGREFPLQVLQSIVPFDATTLEIELKQLLEAGIVFRRGAGSRARFVFKHALIRDAAYESLLEKDRRELHREIVRVMEASFPDVVARNPELLARHCALGGLVEEAVEHWRQAGVEASARSANLEAISHFREALRLLAESEADPELRAEKELDLRTSLVQALTAAKGYAAPELEGALRRLEELAKRTGDDARLTTALRGLFHLAHYSGRSEEMLEYSGRFLEHAKQLDDPLLLMEAHFQAGMTLFCRGDLGEAREHKEEGLRIVECLGEREGDPEARALAHGKALLNRSLLAVIYWICGRPEQASDLIREALRLGRQADPLNQALAWHNAGSIYLSMGLYEEAREHARRALEISEENELFTRMVAQAGLDLIDLRAETAPEGGSASGSDSGSAAGTEAGTEALERLRRTIRGMEEGGARFGLSYFYCHLAEIQLRRQATDAAERSLDSAAALIESLDERVWLPETLRIRGELLRVQGRRDAADEVLERSIEVARRQEARSFELRSTLALVRGWEGEEREEEARERLQGILGRFDEGFDTPELVDARDLHRALLRGEANGT